MSFIDKYHQTIEKHKVSISDEQGSHFAKQVAGDFNPIHDIGSKRFCVPGDLLFALALNRYGIHHKMGFKFTELVSANTPLTFPTLNSDTIQILNHRQKPVLNLELGGSHSSNPAQIENLTRQYVAFSGQNFPHILMPLMQDQDVMINPARPLIIYESMSFELTDLTFSRLDLALAGTELQVSGKRGTATLRFTLNSDGKTIGTGVKTLLLSGLRPYDHVAMDRLYTEYLANKDAG